MYEVEAIIIYPVKGLGGIKVSQCEAKPEGFSFDRHWLIVDEDNGFISQRQHPEMALIKTEMDEDRLYLSYGGDTISMPLYYTNKIIEVFPVTIWKHTVDAFEWSSEVSGWLSNKLGQEVRLVARAPEAVRLKEIPSLDKSVPLSFADGYPYLILGLESVRFLNEKLDTPITYNRFRPNIVVKTDVAHIEDSWKELKVGSALLQVVKPCVRCQVIGIDQQTAEKSRQPIATLNSYRKQDNGIIFGANTICNGEGIVKVGDKIVLKK